MDAVKLALVEGKCDRCLGRCMYLENTPAPVQHSNVDDCYREMLSHYKHLLKWCRERGYPG